MSKASLGAGNVEVKLDGQTVTLRPSLAAAQAISRREGGIMATVQAIARFDFDALSYVIAHGLGQSQAETAEKVWTTGISALAPKAIEFCTILANGGRPVGKTAGGEEAGDPPNA